MVPSKVADGLGALLGEGWLSRCFVYCYEINQHINNIN